MENLTSILKMELEFRELSGKFGNESCFDFPNEYERMTELETSICKAIDEATKSRHYYMSIDKNIIQNIVVDYGEDSLKMGWHLYTYDEYIEAYEVFKTDTERSLYSFDLNNGKDWLQANELNEVEHLVYTRDFIATAHDEI